MATRKKLPPTLPAEPDVIDPTRHMHAARRFVIELGDPNPVLVETLYGLCRAWDCIEAGLGSLGSVPMISREVRETVAKLAPEVEADDELDTGDEWDALAKRLDG